MAAGFKHSSLSADEFYSQGCRKFMRIVRNPQLSVKNARNYLLKSIKRSMCNLLWEENNWQKNMLSLDDVVRVENMNGNFGFSTERRYFVDKRASNPANVCFLHEILSRINGLDPRKRKVFLERFLGTPSAQTAEKLGLTVANVDQIKKRVTEGLIRWSKT